MKKNMFFPDLPPFLGTDFLQGFLLSFGIDFDSILEAFGSIFPYCFGIDFWRFFEGVFDGLGTKLAPKSTRPNLPASTLFRIHRFWDAF